MLSDALRTIREAAERFNRDPQDLDARTALAVATLGKRVIVVKVDNLIDVDETADVFQFAVETKTHGDDSALLPDQLFAKHVARIEADPVSGLPLRKGKTTQAPIVDWSGVSTDLRKVAAYAVIKGERIGSPEQVAYLLSDSARYSKQPPWPRLVAEWNKVKADPDQERLMLRVKERLFFQKEKAPAVSTSHADLSGRSQVRAEINRRFCNASDFDAFIMDNFPEISRQFSNGMDRMARINLLLQYTPVEDIARALRAA